MQFEQLKSGIAVPVSFAASKRPEMREVATTRDGRDITRGYVDPLMLQQPSDSVLRMRGNGDYTIYKELLRDEQVASTFWQRRLAVISKEWEVDAGGDSKADKAAADHLRETLNEVGFDNATDKMLFGVYFGFAVGELMWGRDGRHITLDQIKVRDRVRFGYDGYGALRLKTNASPDGELMPDKKFWHFCTGADHDDEPYGIGLAHWLYWPVFFKRAGMRYWMTFLERFGQPTTLGKHPTNATPAERQKLLDALAAINTDSGIAIPFGMEVSFLEAARSGTADYSKVCEYMDRAIAKMTVGQTASSEGTPGRLGNDDLQGDVRNDLIKSDADLVCESFNRSAAKWLTEYNYPGANAPRVYRKVQQEEDQTQRSQRDKNIFDMGYRPTLAAIQDTYGGEWEPVQQSTPALPINSAGVAPRPRVSFAEAGTPVPEQMMEQARAFVEPTTNLWINRIRELANSVSTLEQLQDELLKLAPEMTLDEYAEAFATVTAAARLAGSNEIVEGEQ